MLKFLMLAGMMGYYEFLIINIRNGQNIIILLFETPILTDGYMIVQFLLTITLKFLVDATGVNLGVRKL